MAATSVVADWAISGSAVPFTESVALSERRP
jgi:hypothetical protein